MKKSPEFLVGLVIIILIAVGVIAYVVGVPSVIAPTTPGLPSTSTTTSSTDDSSRTTTYTDPSHMFSFAYPAMFTLSGGEAGYTTDWSVESTSTGLALVKVVIPQSFEPKTNFGDAKFTVGTSADPDAVKNCLVASASGSPVQESKVTINGVEYTKIASSGVGAGNLYETTSYRTVHKGQCYAIEYTIHSSNIGNYPTDSGITAFDKTKVQSVLEGIVQSFAFSS